MGSRVHSGNLRPQTFRVSSASNEALDNFFGLLPLLLKFKPLKELLTNLNHELATLYFWMDPLETKCVHPSYFVRSYVVKKQSVAQMTAILLTS